MTWARWPAQECLHENTRGEMQFRDGRGRVIKRTPDFCYDCRSHRDLTTDEWVSPKGGQ